MLSGKAPTFELAFNSLSLVISLKSEEPHIFAVSSVSNLENSHSRPVLEANLSDPLKVLQNLPGNSQGQRTARPTSQKPSSSVFSGPQK